MKFFLIYSDKNDAINHIRECGSANQMKMDFETDSLTIQTYGKVSHGNLESASQGIPPKNSYKIQTLEQ